MSNDFYSELLSLLGKTESSPEFKLFLDNLKDSKIKKFKTKYAYNYLFTDLGIMLEFHASTNVLNLVFLALATEMVKANNLKAFSGMLPSKITQDDDREAVISKLAIEPTERKSPGKTANDPLDFLDYYQLNGFEHCFSFRGSTGELTSVIVSLKPSVLKQTDILCSADN